MGYPIYKTNYQLMAQSRETEKNIFKNPYNVHGL